MTGEKITIETRIKEPRKENRYSQRDIYSTDELIALIKKMGLENTDEFIDWINQNRIKCLNDLDNTLSSDKNEILALIEVIIDQKNQHIWITQKTMSKLFKVPKQTILYHIHDIFETGEIEENTVVKEIMTADKDNKKYQTKYYNAEVIISLAYRINSTNAIQFRKWMTKILNEIIVKGHVLDEELLKNGRKVNKEYFDNILEIIQHIKTSKRRFDQKITDIYITSFDYDKNAEITKNFFQEIQNKLIHYVTGKTAKEIITTRSNDKENKTKCTNNTNHNDEMFLGYVIITKNYLNQEELSILNNLVDNLLALAENRAKNNILTNMNDWREITEEYFDSKQAYINV